MELILWRHPEAREALPDAERKLTPKGRKHARYVAEWLLRRLPGHFTVISSPALRAQETARSLGIPFKTASHLAPGASVTDILAVANWPEHKGAVVLIGHQPDLGHAAAHLVCAHQSPWTIKKGGLWWLTNRVRNEESQVVVRAVVTPELI